MLTNNYKTYKIVGFLQEQFEIGEGVFSGETFLDNLEDNKEYNVFFTVINNKNKTKETRFWISYRPHIIIGNFCEY